MGLNPSLDHLVYLGNDDFSPSEAEEILNESIAQVQYNGKQLLISTLSGYMFLNDILPSPKETDPVQSYQQHFEWANSPSTYKQKQVVNTRDADESTIVLKSRKGMMGKWTLSSRSDEWKLIVCGSTGHIIVWNHRIGKHLYVLKSEDPGNSQIQSTRGSSKVGSAVRVGSFAYMAKRDVSNMSKTLTALSFDDNYIVAVGMDGFVHIWEPFQDSTRS